MQMYKKNNCSNNIKLENVILHLLNILASYKVDCSFIG